MLNWHVHFIKRPDNPQEAYIDLYSPTCGSKEKQNRYTHINTVKYNKQEKKTKKKQKAMGKCI